MSESHKKNVGLNFGKNHKPVNGCLNQGTRSTIQWGFLFFHDTFCVWWDGKPGWITAGEARVWTPLIQMNVKSINKTHTEGFINY